MNKFVYIKNHNIEYISKIIYEKEYIIKVLSFYWKNLINPWTLESKLKSIYNKKLYIKGNNMKFYRNYAEVLIDFPELILL